MFESLPSSIGVLRAVIQRAGVGLCLVAPDYRVLMANQQWLDSAGFTSQQALGRSLFDLLPETRDLSVEVHTRAREGETVPVPRYMQRLQGRETWWEGSVVPLPMPGGTGTLITARNVTTEVRAEQERERIAAERERLVAEVQRQAAQLDGIIENMTEGLSVADVEGNVLRVNPAGARILGCESTEEHRRKLPEFQDSWESFYPDGRVMPFEEWPFSRVLRGEVLSEYEARVRRRDAGETKHLSFGGAPVYGRDGKMMLAIITYRDIGERKHAEEALRETRDYLENLLDYANAPIIVWDPDFRITRFSHAFEHLTGRDAKEVVGQRLDLLFPEDSKERSLSYIRSTVGGQRWESVEIPILHKAGDVRTVLWNSATLYTPDQKSVVATIAQGQDITERKRAEAERDRLLQVEHRAREQAEAAVRARDDFLAASAHELKTPITNLRGYSQVIIRRLAGEAPPEPEKTRQALEVIDRQSDRLARLVQQLLDVASIEAGRLELHRQETDLVPLVSGMVESVQAGTTRHTFTLQAPASIPAFVDPVRIEQVVANLLDNAVKFSPAGTPIEVELATPSPDAVRLSVRDHGPGIPPERRPQLFSRFFQAQTGRPFAGLGLGLYYSRRIVELHGGEIRAEFPPEGGSRFVASLAIGMPDRQEEGRPEKNHARAGR